MEYSVGVRCVRALLFGESNKVGVKDLFEDSPIISHSSSSTRAAAATGFATGKKILVGRLHPGNDVRDICAISFVCTLGFVVVVVVGVDVLVTRESRMDDVIDDGKRKRFSFLFSERGTGQDSRRLVLDDFVVDILLDVGTR